MPSKGAFRQVFKIGKYAVKTPRLGSLYRFVHGWLMNLAERQFGVLNNYCPLLFSICGLINVYPYCRPLTEDEFENHKKELSVYDFDDVEYKASSFGWLKGKIVAIDYGDVEIESDL